MSISPTPAIPAEDRKPSAGGPRVLHTLRQIDKAMRRGRGDLSAAQHSVLRHLDGADALSLKQVAERTATSPASASEVVGRLESLGLVTRAHSARDRRAVRIAITAAGKDRLAGNADGKDPVTAALRRMPERQQRQLVRLLARFRECIRAEETAPPPGELLCR